MTGSVDDDFDLDPDGWKYVIDIYEDATSAPTKREAVADARAMVGRRGVYRSGSMTYAPCALVYKTERDRNVPVFIIWRDDDDDDDDDIVEQADAKDMPARQFLALVRRVTKRAGWTRLPF